MVNSVVISLVLKSSISLRLWCPIYTNDTVIISHDDLFEMFKVDETVFGNFVLAQHSLDLLISDMLAHSEKGSLDIVNSQHIYVLMVKLLEKPIKSFVSQNILGWESSCYEFRVVDLTVTFEVNLLYYGIHFSLVDIYFGSLDSVH